MRFARYAWRQTLYPISAVLCGTVIVGVLDVLFTYVDLIIQSTLTPTDVLMLLGYKIPGIIVLFLPITTTFSVMWALYRLMQANEWTALRAAGISGWKRTRPFILCIACLTIGGMYLNDTLVPEANRAAYVHLQKAVHGTLPQHIQSDTLLKAPNGLFLYTKRIVGQTLHDVMIFNPNTLPPTLITAPSGQWASDGWRLTQATQHTPTPARPVGAIAIALQDSKDTFTRARTWDEMSRSMTRQSIAVKQRYGQDTRSLEVMYHLKRSLPMATAVCALWGLTLCHVFITHARDWQKNLGLVVVMIGLITGYYLLTAWGRGLANHGNISPFLGAWLATIVLGSPLIGVMAYGINRH